MVARGVGWLDGVTERVIVEGSCVGKLSAPVDGVGALVGNMLEELEAFTGTNVGRSRIPSVRRSVNVLLLCGREVGLG